MLVRLYLNWSHGIGMLAPLTEHTSTGLVYPLSFLAGSAIFLEENLQ